MERGIRRRRFGVLGAELGFSWPRSGLGIGSPSQLSHSYSLRRRFLGLCCELRFSCVGLWTQELCVLGWRGARVGCGLAALDGRSCEGLVWQERGVVLRIFWRARQLARRVFVAEVV